MLPTPRPTRHVGVAVPDEAPAAVSSGIRKIQTLTPFEQYACVYTDGDGVEHRTVVVRVNGGWFLVPNAEQWAQALRELPPTHWLGRALRDAHVAQHAPIPARDTVDILATGTK